ncbi:MAG: 30S ribosome-binding factor RbfA [Sulfobacillus sp.]
MNQTRADRVAQMMQQELGAMIQKEVKDPRVGFVSITHIDVSRDLSVARIFVSILGDANQAEESLLGLKSAASYLRGEIGRRVGLRHCPQLDFRQDTSIVDSLHIQRIMKTLPDYHD